MTFSYDVSAEEANKGIPLSAKLGKSSRYRQVQDVIQIGGEFDEQLKISFQRTIRVSDGKDASALPPSMGTFPLYLATHHQNTLPTVMRLKGGVFFPMYRKSFEIANSE